MSNQTMPADQYPADWDQRRKKVYQRDDYECQNCGSLGGPRGSHELHADHIKPISAGGSHKLPNLRTLCRSCHEGRHPHMGNAKVSTGESITISATPTSVIKDLTKFAVFIIYATIWTFTAPIGTYYFTSSILLSFISWALMFTPFIYLKYFHHELYENINEIESIDQK